MADDWRGLPLGTSRSTINPAFSQIRDAQGLPLGEKASKATTRVNLEFRAQSKLLTAVFFLTWHLIHKFTIHATDVFLAAVDNQRATANSPLLNGRALFYDIRACGPTTPMPAGTPLINHGAATLPLSDIANATKTDFTKNFIERAIKIIQQDPAAPANDLEAVYIHSIRPSLLADNSMTRELAEFRQVHRGVSYVRTVHEMANRMVGNWKAMIVGCLEDDLLRFIKAGLQQNRLRAGISEILEGRMFQYFQPVFVSRYRHGYALDRQHPLFLRDDGQPLLNQAEIDGIIATFKPFWRLLVYITHPGEYAIGRLADRRRPLPLGWLVALDAVKDANRFHTWRDVFKGQNTLPGRALPLLRYMGLQLASWKRRPDGSLPAKFDSIPICPIITKTRIQRVAFSYDMLAGIILPNLKLERQGFPAIPAENLRVPLVGGGPAVDVRHGRLRPTEFHKRETFNLLLIFHKTKRIVDAHTAHLCGVDVPIKRLFYCTDGTACSLMYAIEPSPDMRATHPQLFQRRIPEWSEIATPTYRNQDMPPPEEVYPGTTATGSLSDISHQPILGPTHYAPHRKVISLDFGQKTQAAASKSHLPTERQVWSDAVAQSEQQLQAGAITPQAHAEEQKRAKKAFYSNIIEISNQHTRVRNFSNWQHQREKARRAKDAEDAEDQEGADPRLSVNERIDALADRQRCLDGQTLHSATVYFEKHLNHWQGIRHFEHCKMKVEKQRLTQETAKRIYDAALVEYISGRSSKATFLKRPKKPTKPRRERIADTKTRRRRDHPRPLLRPIIVGGVSQGNKWQKPWAAVKNKGLLRLFATMGNTVFKMPEKGSSTIDISTLDDLTNGLPPPIVPGDPLSGLTPAQQTSPIDITRHECTLNGHDHSKRGPYPVNRARNNVGHHGIRKYCTFDDVFGNSQTEATSVHAGGVRGRDWRLRASNIPPNYTHPPMQYNDVGGWPDILKPDNTRPLGPVFNRDTSAACALGYGYRHYALVEGTRADWNTNPFVQIPDINVWNNWQNHVGSRHIR